MEDDYVEGLTGEEIIVDMLDQVAAKLRNDCNLRETDAYQGGYDGWVEVHLNLRGLDLAKVDNKVIVNAPASATYKGLQEHEAGIKAESAPEITKKTVDAMVEIPLETKLNVVRERSGQDVPTLSKDESGRPVVKKRHYAKTR